MKLSRRKRGNEIKRFVAEIDAKLRKIDAQIAHVEVWSEGQPEREEILADLRESRAHLLALKDAAPSAGPDVTLRGFEAVRERLHRFTTGSHALRTEVEKRPRSHIGLGRYRRRGAGRPAARPTSKSQLRRQGDSRDDDGEPEPPLAGGFQLTRRDRSRWWWRLRASGCRWREWREAA